VLNQLRAPSRYCNSVLSDTVSTFTAGLFEKEKGIDSLDAYLLKRRGRQSEEDKL